VTRASAPARQYVRRRALCLVQTITSPLYSFCLTAEEVLQIADISRVARDQAGELIGYQRPEVRQHIQEIVDYLDGDEVVFPNPIILALAPSTQFTSSRGPKVSDGLACSGTIEIPLPGVDEPKPGWIVDGQQRALALARTKRRDFPVPVNAFVTHSVELQRDQFLRINNTKPLPRGLVTELLPSIRSPLPPRLSMRRTPSELCDVLNSDPESPFFGLIRRPSSGPTEKKTAVITDTSIVNMLKESFGPTGCLFLYRNTSTSEIDFDGVLSALYTYWHAVRETFPEAWGARARDSRLMHGVGIRSMGRLMDRVLVAVNPRREGALEIIRKELEAIAPYCCWVSGRWEGLDLRWNEVQNVPRHINELSNYVLRLHAALQEAVA
jgi:DGQHR domain-containing protein